MSINRYIATLSLADEGAQTTAFVSAGAPVDRIRGARGATTASEIVDSSNLKAAVDAGSILSFVDGIDPQDKLDVLYAVQLAQRGASGTFDRHTQTRSWYQMYNEILENVGWAGDQFAFSSHDQADGEFRMDKEALAIVAAIATQNQLAVLLKSIEVLQSMAEGDGTIRLFDYHACSELSGNFQLGSVQKSTNGALSMALGAFYFRTTEARRRFLFFAWGAKNVNFWTSAQRLTFNTNFYAQHRDAVRQKLGLKASAFIGELVLGDR